MMEVLVTLIVAGCLLAALAAWALRRITGHLQGNPQGIQAVTEHVLLPLLGRHKDEPEEESASP
jgi:hypothetical protein